jgi:acetoacetyl-CoA reductase/3-oxoacyl-[acyl-carrier protein] reductase
MAQRSVQDMAAFGARAIAVHLVVEERQSIQKALNTVRSELGPINILVNNAAIAQEKPFESITDDDWDRVLAINLRGPFACTQEVLPDMLTSGWGKIINISSIGGQWGGFNQVHYAAAKAGLINLTRSMAKIYSHRGITCNAIAPGLIATDMSAAELETEAGKEKVKDIPAGRLGYIEEVAETVAFLCTDGASYITGQTLNLNGGMYFG